MSSKRQVLTLEDRYKVVQYAADLRKFAMVCGHAGMLGSIMHFEELCIEMQVDNRKKQTVIKDFFTPKK
jgi:hypothetical protein